MNNLHITTEYTSANGNTYYVKMKYSNRLAITYHIGEGIANQYLNGITISAWDGESAKVIAEKTWGGLNFCVFTEEKARQESVEMLKNYLMQQAEIDGTPLDWAQADDLSAKLVSEASQIQTV